VRTPEEILRESTTIALVGASPNPARPSHGVMRYLLAQGYHVIPVRPLTCDEVLGVGCVSSLAEIDEPIDLVDVFRREDAAAEHAHEAVATGAKAFWLQLGLRSPEARQIATAGGLDYVEDRCTAIVHGELVRGTTIRSASEAPARAPAAEGHSAAARPRKASGRDSGQAAAEPGSARREPPPPEGDRGAQI